MMNRKPTLCVVAGPNGSGKTTTTIQLLNNEWAADSLYINPDNIAQETFGDWNSPEAVFKAADRAYIYDNSIDNQLPHLLFRMSDGKIVKQYTDYIPDWAKALL